LKKAFKFRQDLNSKPFVAYWVVSRSGPFRRPETHVDEMEIQLSSFSKEGFGIRQDHKAFVVYLVVGWSCPFRRDGIPVLFCLSERIPAQFSLRLALLSLAQSNLIQQAWTYPHDGATLRAEGEPHGAYTKICDAFAHGGRDREPCCRECFVEDSVCGRDREEQVQQDAVRRGDQQQGDVQYG